MEWLSDPGSWTSRLVFTRGLALVYLVAFLVALRQYRPLLGSRESRSVPENHRYCVPPRTDRTPSVC